MSCRFEAVYAKIVQLCEDLVDSHDCEVTELRNELAKTRSELQDLKMLTGSFGRWCRKNIKILINVSFYIIVQKNIKKTLILLFSSF